MIHIGKTGGSAVRDALIRAGVLDHYVLKFYGHWFKLTDVPKGEKVIFFLRDPISKFVSGFYSRKRQGKPLYNVPWRPFEEVARQKC